MVKTYTSQDNTFEGTITFNKDVDKSIIEIVPFNISSRCSGYRNKISSIFFVKSVFIKLTNLHLLPMQTQ